MSRDDSRTLGPRKFNMHDLVQVDLPEAKLKYQGKIWGYEDGGRLHKSEIGKHGLPCPVTVPGGWIYYVMKSESNDYYMVPEYSLTPIIQG